MRSSSRRCATFPSQRNAANADRNETVRNFTLCQDTAVGQDQIEIGHGRASSLAEDYSDNRMKRHGKVGSRAKRALQIQSGTCAIDHRESHAV